MNHCCTEHLTQAQVVPFHRRECIPAFQEHLLIMCLNLAACLDELADSSEGKARLQLEHKQVLAVSIFGSLCSSRNICVDRELNTQVGGDCCLRQALVRSQCAIHTNHHLVQAESHLVSQATNLVLHSMPHELVRPDCRSHCDHLCRMAP